MSVIRSKKVLLTASVVLLVCCLLAVGLFINFRRLDNLQNEALEELVERIGEYDERSIVLYGTSKAKAESLAERFGAELRITSNGRFATLTLPEGTTIRDIFANKENRWYIGDMSADYQVYTSELEEIETYVSEKLVERPYTAVADEFYSYQSYLDYLNIRSVWDTYKGSGVTIAVIDTGIDTDHPEFAGVISEYSYNATEDKIVKDYVLESGEYDWSLIEDEQGHGTAVAGVIAAPMNNGGIVGIAPEAEIIVIKAECDALGRFKRTSDLVFGLYYAIERDVNVVNMSFSTYDSTNPFAEATQLAYDSDVICIAAAGNESTNMLAYPAADTNVIGVGALASNSWELADYSNYGENTNLVAPGTTYTAKIGGGYSNMTGTSFASPIVAGAVALYMQNNPYITFDQVAEALYISTYDLGDLGRDWYFGFGALDTAELIQGERGKITYDMLTDEVDSIEGKFIRGHALQEVPEPERLYAVFDGWYYDDTFTQEYSYYEDIFYGDITLYAKWVNEDDGVPYTYVELEDGTIEIRSYTGKRKYITVPETINGKPVSSIGDFAFENNTKLREVVLPDSINHIGIGAFANCANIVTINIPENVTEIEKEAFKDAVRLSTVAFQGNSKLTSIGDFAFANCSSLRAFEVPSRVEYLNGSAFFGTAFLKTIKVQKGSVNFVSNDGVLFDYSGSELVAFPAAKGNTYTLPDNTIVIGDYAFGYCKLEQVDLNNVQSIGMYSFAFSELRAIDIPDSVIFANPGAFAYCWYLSDVTIGNGLTTLETEMFAYSKNLEKIVIPNTVYIIESCAFMESSLNEVIFEENSALVEIGGGAFYECQIEKIDIPDSVVYIWGTAFHLNPLTEVNFGENSQLYFIDAEAFSYCRNLESITLPDGVMAIGDRAFQLSGLKSITVPASVTYLGYGAFAGCDITAIEIEEGNTVYYDEDGVVYTKDNLTLHAYPSGKQADGYIVKSGVETIAPYACAYAPVYRYALPESLTQISEYAFYCASILDVHIPDNVLQIGRFAFARAEDLQEIYFTENAKLPRISYQAFAYSYIHKFTVPSNVSTIAQGAFEGTTNLSKIIFAKNSKIESISAYMFDGCENLGSVVFEEGSALTSIQAHAFENTNLAVIDFGDAKLENIDNFAFRFCTNLWSISLPETLKNIGRYAFYGCHSLYELRSPENVEHIGSYAFLGTNDIELYFASETLPLYLDENWDKQVKGYYTGVTEVLEQGDYKYAVLSSGNIAIIEYLGNEAEIDLTKLDFGGNITIIGGGAFKDTSVKSVVLPETLTSIQAEAFAYSPLERVVIPKNVTFIGREAFAHTDISLLVFESGSKINFIEQYAFIGTKNLKTVTLPASLSTMGTGVFMQSGLTSVTFEKGIAITEIPQKAFAETKLTSVTLPDSVVLVNHNAFNNVQTLKTVSFGNNEGIRLMSNAFYHTGLETLHIPANVTYIGEYCFVALSNLNEFTVDANNPNYTAVDGLLLSKNGRKLISVPAGRSGILSLPVSVEEIGFGAFEESKLTQVLFDKNANVLSLGYRAFFKSAITKITVPKSVVAVDYYAFAYCDNLTTVIFEEGSNLKGIYEGAFCGDGNLENIVIPESIVEISEFAFYSCTKIKDIPVENSEQLKGIYDYAFAYTGINGELVIPESVIDIGSYAFRGTGITKLTIPDTNKLDLVIYYGAFQECNKLEEVTLPFIGASYEDNAKSWLGYIFGATKGEVNNIYVPQSLKKVTITEGITIIGPFAFYQCNELEEINIPESISLVADTAFKETSAKHEFKNVITFYRHDWITGEIYGYLDYLYEVFGSGISGTLKIAEGVTSIYLSGFDNLEKIVLPKSTLDFTALWLNGLKEIDINEGLESIVIWYAPNLIKVDLPDSINDFQFNSCTGLKTVHLPQGIETIPRSAFSSCESLTSIVIPDGVAKIEEGAFYNCDSLQQIYIPESVVEIGSMAFQECAALTSIKIPSSVTEIKDNTFAYCSSLTDIVLPDNLQRIGTYAFGICHNLRKITLPEKLEYIGDGAFWNIGEIINNSNLVLEFGSSDNGEIAMNAKKITEKDGTVRYRTASGSDVQETIVTSDGFTFFKSKDSYFLDGYIGKESTITFPRYINGAQYTVSTFLDGENIIIPNTVVIGNYAFSENKTIKSVVFEDGNTQIGNNAFSFCSNLEKVVLPDGLTVIGSGFFALCTSLKEVIIPCTVTTINPGAFSDCTNLKSIVLPDSLLHICENAFGHSGLEELYIPKNVIEIHYRAFINLNNLNLEKFEIAPENNSYVAVDGIVYNKDVTKIVFAFDGVKNVVIPNTVTDIGNSFCEKRSLETVKFEENSNLKIISAAAFSGSSLQSIEIPNSVVEIMYSAFRNCGGLVSITLPDGLEQIGGQAFSGCSRLESIEIPNGVTEIEYDTFADCSGLVSVTLPNKLEQIGRYAFSGCTQLENINIPETVTHIYDYAFSSCNSLKELHIPSLVELIGSSCFGACSNLELTVDKANANYATVDGVLYSKDMKTLIWIPYNKPLEIVVPNTVIFTYANPFAWHDNITKVVLPEGMTEIPYMNNGMFSFCKNLKEVVIPSTVTKIGDSAFYGCSSLQNVTLPENLKKIGNAAFSNCTNLTSIILPEKLEEIGSSAFSMCYNLRNLNFPDSLKKIGGSAFEYCRIAAVELPNGVELTGGYTFAYNGNLLKATIPHSIDLQSTNIFYNCLRLVEIENNSDYVFEYEMESFYAKTIVDKNGNRTFRDGVTDIEVVIQNELLFVKENGQYTLRAYLGTEDTVTLPAKINGSTYSIYHFNSAKYVIISYGLEEIGDLAFSESYSGHYTTQYIHNVLESIIIPESVKTIGDAFMDCTSLTEIVLPDSVVWLGHRAFSGCTNLEKITFGSNIEYLGVDTLEGTAYYNNPDNWKNGCLYVGTNLIEVDKNAEFVEVDKNTTAIAYDAFNECYFIKALSIPCCDDHILSQLTSIETLILTGYNDYARLASYFGYNIPETLKNVVFTSDFQFRPNDYWYFLLNVSGVTMFVEKEEEDLRWDVNFPDWNYGNRVIYGDDWTWIEFKDDDGNIISRQPRLINQVIIRPYISTPEPVGNIAYKFVGWDVDGDGVADNLPATSTVDISAKAIFVEVERKHTVSFVDTDGKVISSAVLDYNTVITAPATPQKKGHTFMGWLNFEEGMVAEKDVVFIAQWQHDGNGHVWSAPTVVAPTCTEKGYTVITCGICGEQIIPDITSPTGHNWGEVIETTKPSCETEGSGYHVCTSCGEKENVVIEANGHSFKTVQETASTCETHGKIIHKCSVCGKTVETEKELASHTYIKQEINEATASALRKNISGIFVIQEEGKYACYKCSECDRFMLASENTFSSGSSVQSGCRHSNLSEWEELISANCVSFGIDVRYCLDCDKPVEVRIGAAAGNGHIWGEWFTSVKPTCTAVGEEKRECSACDYFETKVIDKLAHTYVSTVTPPTCTVQGYTTHTCECGDSYVDAYVNETGHSFTNWVSDGNATCTEVGTKTAYCDHGCGVSATFRNESSALGHSYGDLIVEVAPTCTSVGQGKYTCTVCGHSETDVIPMLDHTYVSTTTKPTCTEQGYTTHTCVCGDSYVDTYTKATGHSFSKWFVTKAPTCTAKGEEKRECDNCDHFETRAVDKIAHTYVPTVTKPTCTEGGYTTHTCSCGDSYVDTYTKATGHSFGEWFVTKDPTCTAKGEEKRECDNCDHFETKVVDKVAHNYVSTVTKPSCTEKGYTTHTCKCGDSYIDTYTDAIGHSFTNYVSDGNATLEADGTKTAACDNGCGAKDTVTDVGSKIEVSDITSDKYTVSNGFIQGVSINTTVNGLVSSVNESEFVKVVDKNGNAVSGNTLLATGMKLRLMNGSEVLKEITVVVTGDTNGDGNISVTDMISVKAHILKKSTLTDAYAKAGDTNGDGSISITDFIQIKAHILGKSSLE